MTVLLGRRAAESLVFLQVSPGATDDLNKATEIARDIAVPFGMTPEMGQVTYESETTGFLGPGTVAW